MLSLLATFFSCFELRLQPYPSFPQKREPILFRRMIPQSTWLSVGKPWIPRFPNRAFAEMTDKTIHQAHSEIA